jgi:hypothetical protein
VPFVAGAYASIALVFHANRWAACRSSAWASESLFFDRQPRLRPSKLVGSKGGAEAAAGDHESYGTDVACAACVPTPSPTGGSIYVCNSVISILHGTPAARPAEARAVGVFGTRFWSHTGVSLTHCSLEARRNGQLVISTTRCAPTTYPTAQFAPRFVRANPLLHTVQKRHWCMDFFYQKSTDARILKQNGRWEIRGGHTTRCGLYLPTNSRGTKGRINLIMAMTIQEAPYFARMQHNRNAWYSYHKMTIWIYTATSNSWLIMIEIKT